MRAAAGLLLLLFVVNARAQTPAASAAPTGASVVGHVFCGDNDGPARFARVYLKSTEPSHSGEDFVKETVLQSYGKEATDVMLTDSDATSVRLEVAAEAKTSAGGPPASDDE